MNKKEKIDYGEVEHIARLARLGLSPQDREKFAHQLNDILVYMEKLDELEVEGVKPLAHVLDLKNVFRKDKSVPGLDRKEILDNAPQSHEGFFKVPPVIE